VIDILIGLALAVPVVLLVAVRKSKPEPPAKVEDHLNISIVSGVMAVISCRHGQWVVKGGDNKRNRAQALAYATEDHPVKAA
jgi:hypothetical protein